MTEQTVLDVGARTIWIAMLVGAPVLISTLVAGLLVSIVQAATQINEQTLSFIPKIIVMSMVLAVCGPWILQTMMNFTTEIFNRIPMIAH